MQLPAERRRITLEKPTARGNSLTRGRKLSFTLRMKRLANRSQITVVSTLPPLAASNTLLIVFECLGQRYQRDRRITLPFMFSVSSFRISSSRVSHKTKLNARDRTECVLEWNAIGIRSKGAKRKEEEERTIGAKGPTRATRPSSLGLPSEGQDR